MFPAIKKGRNHLGKELKQAKFGGKDCEYYYSSRFGWRDPLLLLIIITMIINEFNPKARGIIGSVGMKVL